MTECAIEELLIDFRELEGKHSGANMVEATWETLTCFGIKTQVCYEILKSWPILSIFLQIMAIMTDNVSNNNTLVDAIVEHAKKQGILMKADWV